MYRLFIVIILALSLLTVGAANVNAANCPVMYGGGTISCPQTTNTPTPAPTKSPANQPTPTQLVSQPKPTTAPTQTKTKGGLSVHPAKQVKKTPATGPEAFSLIGLLPTAAAGFWLRRKSK